MAIMPVSPKSALSALMWCAALLGGCSAQTSGSAGLGGSNWRIAQIDGSVPAVPARATLNFADRQVNASIGCNRLGGDYRIEAGRLIAGPLVQTEMYCGDPLASQERALSALLVGAPALRLTGGTLVLQSSGHSARFERIPKR